MAEYVRFADGSGAAWGLLGSGDEILEMAGPPWLTGELTGRRVSGRNVRLLAPVAPGKVIGVGLNYRAHAGEMNAEPPSEPVIFLKAVSALLNPEESILLPSLSKRVEFEGEVAIVIGAHARQLGEAEAAEHIFGYTAANDVTARDLQQDGRWSRAKSFDTFLPVGPVLASGLPDPRTTLTTVVNGELRQEAMLSEQLFSPAAIVAYVSRIMTLLPGDLILTGTPDGVGPLHPGDTVEVTVQGLGTLRNRVSDGL